MGDQNPKDDPAATVEEPKDDKQDPPKDDPAATVEEPKDDELGAAGKAALIKEREERRALEKELKALKPKAEQYDKLEDAKKDQATKDAERIAELEKKLAESDLRQLRRDVADAKKLPASLARRLSGETKDDLEADADKLLTELKELQGGDDKDDKQDPPKKKGAPAVQKTDKPQPTGLAAAVAARIKPTK